MVTLNEVLARHINAEGFRNHDPRVDVSKKISPKQADYIRRGIADAVKEFLAEYAPVVSTKDIEIAFDSLNDDSLPDRIFENQRIYTARSDNRHLQSDELSYVRLGKAIDDFLRTKSPTEERHNIRIWVKGNHDLGRSLGRLHIYYLDRAALEKYINDNLARPEEPNKPHVFTFSLCAERY